MNQRLVSAGLLGVLLTLGCELGPPNGIGAMNDAGPGEEGCDALTAPGDPDKPRVVLTAHSTKGVNVDGVVLEHFLRSASLTVEDGFTDIGAELALGFSPVRVEMVPSGRFAMVLGDEGELASVAVESDGTLALVDEVDLARYGMNDLRVSADGRELFAVGADVTPETSGVSVIRVGCDGSLEVVEDAFFGLRLTDSLAFLPGEDRAVLLGGQAVFEPIDDDDVRLLARDGDGFEQIGAFDLYGDFIDALRIAVSPDGSTLLIPNGSPLSTEGNTVLVATVDGDSVTESHRLTDLEDAREALFSPDGQTALVTLFSANRVKVLADEGEGLAVVSEIAGIGLAEQMALVSRGALSGTVLVTSVDASGSNVARLRITGPGVVEDLGQLDLPEGLRHLPRAIAVQP